MGWVDEGRAEDGREDDGREDVDRIDGDNGVPAPRGSVWWLVTEVDRLICPPWSCCS